jgi:hypothetical protein
MAAGRGHRFLWFVALYAGSAVAFVVVVYLLRAIVSR